MYFCIISINIHEFLIPKKGNSVNFNDYEVSSDVIYIENALQSLNNFSVYIQNGNDPMEAVSVR